MTTPEPQSAAPKPNRGRYQYSLAELFTLTTIIAIGLSLLRWLAIAFGIDVVKFVVLFWGLYVGWATWLFVDARKRGYSGVAAVLLFTLLGPFGVVLWLSVRPKSRVVIRPPADYANPDDALAAAYQLDMNGDWDAAVALYGEIAGRWSEHEQYACECLMQLEEKRSRLDQKLTLRL